MLSPNSLTNSCGNLQDLLYRIQINFGHILERVIFPSKQIYFAFLLIFSCPWKQNGDHQIAATCPPQTLRLLSPKPSMSDPGMDYNPLSDFPAFNLSFLHSAHHPPTMIFLKKCFCQLMVTATLHLLDHVSIVSTLFCSQNPHVYLMK